jgi:hypothetical protein
MRSLSPSCFRHVRAHTYMHKCVCAFMQGILGAVFHALEDCFLAEIALLQPKTHVFEIEQLQR